MSAQRVAITPALIQEVGLPVYPGATPMTALRQVINVGGVSVLTTGIVFRTPAPAGRVDDFYRHQLPSSARRIHFQLGAAQSTTYSISLGIGRKVVTVARFGSETQIQLENTQPQVAARPTGTK